MKQKSTLFLKAVIVIFGLAVLALCVFALPTLFHGPVAAYPGMPYAETFIGIIMYAAAIPFYIALYQGFKLLNYIDANKAFSEWSVKSLGIIKYCAIAVSVLYFGMLPFLYPMVQVEDSPGLMLFATVFATAPLVIAVFAAVLQKLLRSAIDLKSENDLTV
ncbi:MAG: hypothetical protein JWM20_884 [Patescibacteria group bacterium]|nr:hypothetical protein [Patescibacteria group bacterium]